MLWMLLLGSAITARAKDEEWRCPDITNASCSCDLPHTLRCTASYQTFPAIADCLRKLAPPLSVSLLDCTLRDLDIIEGPVLEGVSLHGLVVSSGVLKSISTDAFSKLKEPLEALGLPNNQLKSVPTQALKRLSSLTRLDLSHNVIYSLHDHSFKGLISLEYLDLSGNNLENMSCSTFIQLPRLKVLRLQSNGLKSNTVPKLHGLLHLEKLDLGNNALTGPLNFSSFPKLPNLKDLNLAHNQISSVAKEALSGLGSLTSLSLKYNMIDILEDNAFHGLSMLTTLDLAHNRMVAVSEASLAHLTKLEFLDVSHNFLRALTSDIISPLTNLKELRLDENDISIINKDALRSTKKLEILTLAENPLNCDCNLSEFAEWLRNSTLNKRDKNTAICATPPTLENAFVEQVLPDKLICGSQDDLPVDIGQHPMPVSGSRVVLQGYNYDGNMMYLLWNIQTVGFYHCQSLYVYEELGVHEVLLEHNDLHCNSTTLTDPHSLPISWQTHHLQKGHRYRYCVVMIEKVDVESALILGCSEVITLIEHMAPQIRSLKANITSTSPLTLTIQAQVWPHSVPCYITFHISVVSKFFKKAKLNCSSPKVHIQDVPSIGPYKICALISNLAPYCIWIHPNETRNTRKISHKGNNNSLLLFGTLLILIFIFILLAYLLFRWLKNVLMPSKIHEQCFIPASQDEQHHSRYVKLQATTKL